MSRKIRALKPTAPIDEALAILGSASNISCLPIVDDEFRPLGIVSWRDLLRTWRESRRFIPDTELPA